MRNCFVAAVILLAGLVLSAVTHAQTGPIYNSNAAKDQQSTSAPVLLDGWGRPVDLKPGEKPGSAPRHDISGTWAPARSPGDGIQPAGAKDMPHDGKPEHDPPYTPLGLETQKSNSPRRSRRRGTMDIRWASG
jgi:hypothetical protein